ncbi:MAG: TlpA family protein disulfide reductase [Candidatus Atribacteria bacterium]|nr:TlpA family protein disulfide reductase [Candidatus Atribacteria bacterium]
MKKTPLFIRHAFFFALSIVLIQSCAVDVNDKDYLQNVLENIHEIESANYLSIRTAYAPFDTLPYSVQQNYVKEYKNDLDTFVRASFVNLNKIDSTKMDYCYDGNIRARVHWDERTMEIDSLRKNPFSSGIVRAPFFEHAKRILEYTLSTKDSMSIEVKNSGDTIQYTFTIYDTIVEFGFQKLWYQPPFFGPLKGSYSRYDIFINKKTNLPFRIIRDQPHDKTIELCKLIDINKEKLSDFVASEYFPDFPLRSTKNRKVANTDLIGKQAPDWILNDADGKSTALKDLQSKVVLVEFTSVSCGPCKAAIPFLKKLVTEYNKEDFDFVSIEAFAKNSNVLKGYQQRNDFNYKFLMSTKEVSNSYYIKSIPVFFLLDENRIIRKVINGYATSVDDEIRDTINELI